MLGRAATLNAVKQKEIARLSEDDVLALLRAGLAGDEGRPVIRHLRTVGTDASVDALRKLTLSSPDVRTRRAAVITLGRLFGKRSEAAVDALIAAFRSEGPTVVGYAVPTLARRALHPGPLRRRLEDAYGPALPVLAAGLRDPSRRTRKMAADALSYMQIPQARSELESAAREFPGLRGRPVRRALSRWFAFNERYGPP